MVFDYEHYKSISFKTPLIQFTIGVVVLIVFVIYLVVYFKKGNALSIKMISGILVPIFFIITSSFKLQYSIHLINENQNDVVEYTGEITEIEKIMFSPRYYHEDLAVHPKMVTIEGEKFYFMTIGDLELGDTVEISYLPDSRYVLEVDKEE